MTTFINFFLSGEVLKPQIQLQKTHAKRGTYPTLSALEKTIQIKNPEKLDPKSILHEWDFRRGIVTTTALKRMSENIQTDTSLESDDSESPPKRRKVTKEIPCEIQEQKKNPEMSPLSLRRRYLPRRAGDTAPAHRAAAAAAAPPQKKHPPAPHTPEKNPSQNATSNRLFRVIPFKPGL